MALTYNSIGGNPQQPGIAAEAFIPDQLIAGNLKLVTDSVTITGSAALQRGSVLGRVTTGTVSASTGKAFATGTIAVAALPAAGDTVTIGGTVVTMVAANPVGNQVVIGATVAATAQNLIASLLGSTDTNLMKFTYTLSSATITFTAAVIGTGGNSLTLATSNGTAFTVSGGTLSGGTANTGTATVGTMSAGAQMKAGNYQVVLTSATVGNVFDPAGDQLGTTTMGTQFTDAQISFLITTGGSPAAGDTFVLAAAPGTGKYKLASAAAVDGSQIPAAILADYTDASGGDVIGGIYVMGEFNGNALTLGPGMSLGAIKNAFIPNNIYIKTCVNANDPN